MQEFHPHFDVAIIAGKNPEDFVQEVLGFVWNYNSRAKRKQWLDLCIMLFPAAQSRCLVLSTF